MKKHFKKNTFQEHLLNIYTAKHVITKQKNWIILQVLSTNDYFLNEMFKKKGEITEFSVS